METKTHLFCAECNKMLNIRNVRKQVTGPKILRPGQPDIRIQEFFVHVDVCSCVGGKRGKKDGQIKIGKHSD